MILAIVGLDIAEEAIVVLAEILVARSQSGREVVCTQVNDGHCRVKVGLSSIPTGGLSGVHIVGLEIAIRHPPVFELRVVVARNTHTRVSYCHIVSAEIAWYDGSIGARCILGLWCELLQTALSIDAIATSIAIADELQLTLSQRSRSRESALEGGELVNGSSTLFALGTLLHNDLMYSTARFFEEGRIH